MIRQLPPRASLEQLRKQAKALLKAEQAADPEASNRIRQHHPRFSGTTPITSFTLADAQLVLAREYGFTNWAALKSHLESRSPEPSTEALIRSLRQAAGQGDLAQLTALLDAHPELIDEPGGEGVRTALHQTIFGEQEAAAKLLLERGANPNIRCEGDNAYPLHFAAEKQHLPLIRLLIEHGADPIGEDDYHELGVIGWATAWDYVRDNPEVVDYLLSHGARHNISSAVATGDVLSIRRLVAENRSLLEKRMDLANKRRRPLHLAVIKKRPEALSALLDLGANAEALDECSLTALDQAALDGETAMAEILLAHGAKVRLPAAICLHRTRDAERLLRRDPECLKPGNRWGTLIVRAAERAPGAVIDALLRAGASVDVSDDPKTAVDTTSGYTPLHAAAFRGNRSAVEALLAHHPNLRIRETKWHGTPAGWADYAGHPEIRDLILRGPVDIMEAVEYGLTERIAAIVAEDPAALNRPFEQYPVYPRYAEGWHTPLAFSVARGKADTVRWLLDHGADASVHAPAGQNLAALASENGHADIAQLLASRTG